MGTLTAERFMKIGIMALLVLMLAGYAHAAPTITLTETRITTDLADQLDPAISGDIIVYTDIRGMDADIWYYDLSKNQEFQASSAPWGDQELTDVSDGKITYTDLATMSVLVYDTSTGTTTDLTGAARTTALDSSISGNIVAWKDYRSDQNAEIYARDLATNEERRISFSPDSDERPKVNNGKIVWQRCPTSISCDIWAYDWTTRTTTQVTNTPNDERSPDISGSNIVYQGNDGVSPNGDDDIYLYNLDTGVVKRLSLPGHQSNPAIWGDHVTFDDYSSGRYHVKLYKISTNSFFDIVTPASQQFLNDIWDNHVVYTDDRNGQLDIYMTEFTLPPPIVSITPNYAAAGNRVFISDLTGSGFKAGATVQLTRSGADSITAYNVMVTSPTKITCDFNIPSTAVTGMYTVVVTNIDGSSGQLTDGFEVRLPIPITSITPNYAAAGAKGIYTDIAGERFQDGAYVQLTRVGTISWTAYVVFTSPTKITCYLEFPSTAVTGIYTVLVRNPDGTYGELIDGFEIGPPNAPPVAEAGDDQLLQVVGSTVYLSGAQSYDEDGDPLTYQWTLLSKPVGSTAALTGADTVTPTFVADKNGAYSVQLVVSDGKDPSAPDTVTVSFQNIKPVADAGTSQSLTLGETATLDGRQSSDLNGDPLTYYWSLTAVPAGSTAPIVNPAASLTTVTPDRAGTYTVQLIVNDGLLDSDPSTIQILVVAKETKIITDIQDLETTINGFESGVFKNANMQNALINKLNAVIAAISTGDYTAAINQLQNDVLAKTDGCALSGAPDKIDWIRDCETQGILYPKILSIINELKLL
jgi:beta propeller repeat protein